MLLWFEVIYAIRLSPNHSDSYML